MTYDVFISYSSKHKDAADAICHLLEANGIRCWIAPRDIQGGQQYGDVIETAIIESQICVLVFSKSAQESQWVNAEINLAFEQNKTIIPFKVEDAPIKGQIKLMLNQKHWIDAYPNYKEKFQVLVTAVSNALGVDNKQTCSPRPQERSTSPSKKWGKILLGIFASITTILLFIIIGAKIFRSKQEYHYDKNGIHVHIKGLSDSQREATTSILDNMILIEGGVFVMGNTPEMIPYLTEQDSLSVPSHKVKLDHFYISKYEVTQKQWRAFMKLEGRCILEGDSLPMDMLSWNDAKAFTDTLAAITKLHFSLPTEAQWEYAARGGKKTHNYIFAGHNWDATEVGWTSFDQLSSAHAAGGKRENELGLYNMTGNVSEWCYDYFDVYTVDFQTNPIGPNKGYNRVLRGGDFRTFNQFDMKVSTRYFDGQFVNRRGAGMRLVINIDN